MPVTFALAGPGDEAEIRRLLRDNPMGEDWRIALAREPDGLGGPHWPGERRHFVLARDGGTAIGLCERVVRPAFVDGEVHLLPYLGALRVAQSHRHRIAVLKGGFARLRAVERPDECPFALTSIAADNAPARRVLTAGIAGLPLYRPVGRYVTRMMRAVRQDAHPGISAASHAEVATFLQTQPRRAFAPAWDKAALAAFPEIDWLALRDAGVMVGVVGLWDQRASRQAVVRGLPPALAGMRRLANLAAPLHGLPAIPAIGEPIDQAFVTALSTRDDDPALALHLLAAAVDLGARAGRAVATAGLPAAHGWLPAMRDGFRAIEYETELFLVHWPEHAGAVGRLGLAAPFPDVALL